MNTKIHPAFKVNDKSFVNSKELCSFVQKFSLESAVFLEDWFDDKEVVVVQTSGSTGVPKTIEIKKSHMRNSALATGDFFELRAGTRALLCMSSEYIAGKMMWVRALLLGWEMDVVVPVSNPLSTNTKRYDFSAMVPLQVANSINELERVKKLIVGGGVLSKEVEKQLQTVTTKVYATYGMTETVTHIAIKKINQTFASDYYQTLPSVKVSIDDRGCLVIDAPKIADEIVVTNDMVEIQSENSFQWLGRFDSVINSGGVKIIPEQIEKELSKTISGNFFVAGIHDDLFGEKVVLIVEGKGNLIQNKPDILHFLKNTKLSAYQVPKAIYFVEKFEMTDTKKIKRKATLSKLF
ncbi:AMP-binding protein [Flavicella marina]|uniref:AMP-binding protein n=1 Tax=Flavicella marina TaxID=1475951 RepID=UPI001263FE11|nr:AMP-binding protein [Flavicella marina]